MLQANNMRGTKGVTYSPSCFFLRVETDKVILRLPASLVLIKDNIVEVTFNWIVLEDEVHIISVQTFMEDLREKHIDSELHTIIENFELDEETTLHPDDSMYRVEAKETGCFTSSVPVRIILDVDSDFLNPKEYRGG